MPLTPDNSLQINRQRPSQVTSLKKKRLNSEFRLHAPTHLVPSPPLPSTIGSNLPVVPSARRVAVSMRTMPGPVQTPLIENRPTTANMAAHAVRMANSSLPSFTNLIAQIWPVVAGGPSAESRQTGNKFAAAIRQHLADVRRQNPAYADAISTSNKLSRASTVASVMALPLHLLPPAGVVASTAGSLLNVGSGVAELAATKALLNRPRSSTGRAHHLVPIHLINSREKVVSGLAGLTLPGAGIAAKGVHILSSRKEMSQGVVHYVNSVRIANELQSASVAPVESPRKLFSQPPARPKNPLLPKLKKAGQLSSEMRQRASRPLTDVEVPMQLN